MAELLDIFDANMNPVGVASRDEVHARGLWHRTYHLWLVTPPPQPALLFQLRSTNVDVNPGLLDISAAGHLATGETVDDGLREVNEELGLAPPRHAIHPLGYRTEVADYDNGVINREFQAVHLAQIPLPLSEYTPDPHEVEGLFEIRLEDCFALFSGTAQAVPANGTLYDKGTGRWQAAERRVEMPDFVKRIQPYYLTMTIMAERLCDGKFPLSVS